MDGRVARMTNTQSAFGEQYDSLADMVSFGVAPALVAYEWALKDLGKWGWLAAFTYCAGAALRLARFNVNTGVVDKKFFQRIILNLIIYLHNSALLRRASSSEF
jgi:CDP-diacylglycerol--serine O-phosphatidyltransferase